MTLGQLLAKVYFSASSLESLRKQIVELAAESGGNNYNVVTFTSKDKIQSHEFGPSSRESCEQFIADRLPLCTEDTRMGIMNTIVMAKPDKRPIKFIPILRG